VNIASFGSALHKVPATADEWFAYRHSPDWTPQDQSVFDAWMRANPSHAADYSECERLWDVRNRLAANSDLVRAAFGAAGLNGPRHLRAVPAPRPWKWTAAVALAAGVAVLAWIVVAPGRAVVDPDAVATAHGQQREMSLSDGSKVHLNTDTLVVARLDDRERRVVLKRGEAFFDVARDSQRPFVVEVGTTEVRVVGTKFSVRESEGKVEVLVSDGLVNVVPEAKKATTEAWERVELTRGNRLQYDTGQKLMRVAHVDPDRLLLWRGGMIEFDNSSLEDAVSELNRYAAKPLSIEDQRLRGIKFSGGFRVGDVSAVLFTLRERFDVAAVEEEGRIVLRLAPK
jgi:transmembrane sensor